MTCKRSWTICGRAIRKDQFYRSGGDDLNCKKIITSGAEDLHVRTTKEATAASRNANDMLYGTQELTKD